MSGGESRMEVFMKRSRVLFAIGIGIVVGMVTILQSTAGDGDHAFVGADKCKMCHNSEAKGAQYTKWSQTPHAKAYAALASEPAKKIASEKGIADPQKAAECLKCHVTGHGMPAEKLTDKYKVEDGVGCESCHGAGGDYWKMDVMKDQAKSIAAGLVIPDEKTCTKCHNSESPTFKGFNFKEAAAKIAHPNPQAAGQ